MDGWMDGWMGGVVGNGGWAELNVICKRRCVYILILLSGNGHTAAPIRAAGLDSVDRAAASAWREASRNAGDQGEVAQTPVDAEDGEAPLERHVPVRRLALLLVVVVVAVVPPPALRPQDLRSAPPVLLRVVAISVRVLRLDVAMPVRHDVHPSLEAPAQQSQGAAARAVS
jgi:hypothetical protein